MRLAWMTDPHLNFIPPHGVKALGSYLTQDFEFDKLLITGDIAEAASWLPLLSDLHNGIGEREIFFVFGNHDFYRGSIEVVKRKAWQLKKGLTFLEASGPIELAPHTALVGHSGMFDGRLGDVMGSRVIMEDWNLIHEFTSAVSKSEIVSVAQNWADRSASESKIHLLEAIKNYPRVIFGTHFPPFKEAAIYDDKVSDDNWLPWYTNAALGHVLIDLCEAHPSIELTVLCGHTHGRGETNILPNLKVITGQAQYRQPNINQIFEI